MPLDFDVRVYFAGTKDYIYRDRLYEYDETRFGVELTETYYFSKILDWHTISLSQEWYMFDNTATVVENNGYVARLSGGYGYGTTADSPFKLHGFEIDTKAVYAGFGGAKNYLLANVSYKQFIPIDKVNIAAFKIAYGIAFDPEDDYDFVVGSNKTVRGYTPKNGKAGNMYLLGNFEYRRYIKLPPQAVELSGFTDIGIAGDGVTDFELGNVISSIGAGIRFYVPWFDIFRIDLAVPINASTKLPRLVFGVNSSF